MFVDGSVAPGLELVRDVFARNFSERGEQGAAVAAYVHGEKVVDLWGGYQCHRSRQPWTESTLTLTFSVTKGMAAAVFAVAHSRGWIDLEARVADYWPEFAHAGKDTVSVRQLLSHQAGLIVIDSHRVRQSLHDLDALAEILACQRPAWKPGVRHGYHTLTLGWYQNELFRRIDPHQRSLGVFFQQEIATPLGVEYYIGLPPSMPEGRLAVIEGFNRSELLRHAHELPIGMVLASIWPFSLVSQSIRNLPLRNPAEIQESPYRFVEIPSANGIGTARAVARVYSELVKGASGLLIHDATRDAITGACILPSLGCRDAILKIDTRYQFGFSRPSRVMRFGTDGSAFGAFGAGGSFGMGDPVLGIGYAYATNKMGFRLFDDPRELAVRRALYECIAGR